MIIEDYCSFEVAKLLKEKGFNEQCRNYYVKEYDKWIHRNTYEYNYFNLQMPRWKDCYSCPTHQMAMAWLRENGIIIEILHVTSKPVNDGWFYSYQKNNDSETNLIEYPSYEEAVEAALKYCLKLI